MSALRDFFYRLTSGFHREQLDQEMAEEMQFHLNQRIAENMRDGLSPEESRREALRKFGGVEQLKERAREERGIVWVEQLAQDLRYAARSVRRNRGFVATIVLTLALGVGAITTAFSWIERVLLQPLPGVGEVVRVVALETVAPSGETIDTSFPDFQDYRTAATAFSGLLAYKERPLNLGSGENVERVWAQLVTGNFFDVLRVRPRLGRFFSETDRADDASSTPVVVISEALWRRRFAADPGVLGRTVKLNEHEYCVIGVAPAGFLGALNGLAFDAWVPLGTHALLLGPSHWLEDRGWRSLHVLGRLAPGATVASARAELSGVASQLARTYPDSNRKISMTARRLAEAKDGAQSHLAKPLLILFGVASLLLLIVCANVSNLLLIRATSRQREMCIRQALGAGSWRITRQLLVESLLFSLAGAALALLATGAMADGLRRFLPDVALPISLSAQIGTRVFFLAIVIAVGTALLAGLAPVLWVALPDLTTALRASGRTAAAMPRAEYIRGALVVAQVAIALVTLACSALALKSFVAAKNVHPGFEPRGVLLAALRLDTSGYTREQGLAFLDRLGPQLATLPGVEASALAENVPLSLDRGSWENIAVPGYVRARGEDTRVYRNLVSPGYFSLMRIPLLDGREFTDQDNGATSPVAVVSEAFARRYFGGGAAIGRTFSTGNGDRELTVVGVAGDIKVNSLGETAQPYFYVPLRQSYNSDTGVTIQLRTRAPNPLALLPDLRTAVRTLDPKVPIFEAVALDDFIGGARFVQKTAASVLGVLAGVVLALTTVGLYGVLAFALEQRMPEVGLRLALGAQSADIARMVLRRGAALIVPGLGLGLLGALAATRTVASALPGLDAFEPSLLAGVAGFVAVPAVAACWIPARRATKIDPLVALRTE